MFSRYVQLAALLMSVSSLALAEDYVIHVNGIVCEFCSIGVTKKVSRLPFIDKSQYNKGVKVDVEHQRVTIAVLDGASLDQEALFKAIRSGGYEPVEIISTGSATIAEPES